MNHESDEGAYARLYKQFKGNPPPKRKEYTVTKLLPVQSFAEEFLSLFKKVRKGKK